MADIQPILVFDGDDYQIIYSADFNIYEDKLLIQKIAGYDVEFLFKKDSEKKGSPMEMKGDDDAKKITITLYNFNNTLGSGTTKRIPIINTTAGKQVFFSIHAKSLNETTSFLKVSITFYLK